MDVLENRQPPKSDFHTSVARSRKQSFRPGVVLSSLPTQPGARTAVSSQTPTSAAPLTPPHDSPFSPARFGSPMKEVCL